MGVEKFTGSLRQISQSPPSNPGLWGCARVHALSQSLTIIQMLCVELIPWARLKISIWSLRAGTVRLWQLFRARARITDSCGNVLAASQGRWKSISQMFIKQNPSLRELWDATAPLLSALTNQILSTMTKWREPRGNRLWPRLFYDVFNKTISCL